MEKGVSEGLDWRCRDESVAKVGGLALEPLVLSLVVFGFECGEDGIVVGAMFADQFINDAGQAVGHGGKSFGGSLPAA